MTGGASAYQSLYSAWTKSTMYSNHGEASSNVLAQYLPYMGTNATAAIPYPVSSNYTETLGETYSPDSSIGVYFNSNSKPVIANGTVLNGYQWEAYTSNGSSSVSGAVPSSYITKTQGIGSDFNYSLASDGTTLTSQITFKENTLIS